MAQAMQSGGTPLEALSQNDPKLKAVYDYARTCGATDFRQAFYMLAKQKGITDTEGFLDNVKAMMPKR